MKTNRFWRIAALLWLFPFITNNSSAQTASAVCLEEMLTSWQKADLQVLSGKEEPTAIEFQYSYQHSENKGPVVQKIRLEAGNGQSRYMGPEQWIVSDGNETFTWFPDRFVMYRTKPRSTDRFLVREIPDGFFSRGIVTDCDYISHSGNDTLAWKKYRFFPDSASKKQTGISKVEFISDPWDTIPIRLRIDFLPGQPLVWAEYEFTEVYIPFGPEHLWESPAQFVLDGEGKPKPEFKSAKLMDYRGAN